MNDLELRDAVRAEVFEAICKELLGPPQVTTAARIRLARVAKTITARVHVRQPVLGEVRITVGTPRGVRYFQVTTVETTKEGDLV